MQKQKYTKMDESPQSKKVNKSKLNENDKKMILHKANLKKEDFKNFLNPKSNKTITEPTKDEKKDNIIKKKNSKETQKFKKQNILPSAKERDKNKAIDISSCLNQKKQKNDKKKFKIKSNSKKKTLINSFSQKNFGKLKCNNTTKFNISENKNVNTHSSFNRTDSTNNLLAGTDNFIKNLLNNYLDGTDNIINEDLEPFNIIDNNDDYENFSFLEEKNNESNTMRESISFQKNLLLKEDTKKDTINSNTNNMEKIKKKTKKFLKQTNNNNNQIKHSFYKTLISSPGRMTDRKLYMNSQTKFQSFNKKANSPKMRKSLTKSKKKEKGKANQEKKESKIKRKILNPKKIINSMKNLKPNQNSDNNEQKKIETIPISSSNINLDIIFENKNIKTETIAHHYLQNTVSTKNKIVPKKTVNSFEQTKNSINSTNKVQNIYVETDKNISMSKKTILSINRTPKVKKLFKAQERFSFNNVNNNTTRNSFRKSFCFNRELSIENSLPLLPTINNLKIFNGKIDDYLITKELGKGSYAVVKLAVHKITKNKYAIKIYSKQSLIDPQKRNTVKNEINILKQLDNENIMKLYEVIDTPTNMYLVLEYINGINILEILKSEKYHYIKEKRAKKLFLQIVKGISYCHSKNIFHRDIKLENILVLKDDTIKIIDFGFGVKCNRDTCQKVLCGTPSYMPPEILKREKYIACYSDIWSLGVLFYSMLFGKFPFRGKNEEELLEKINEGKLIFPEYNQIEDKTKELFQKIFILNPNKRISLDDMIDILNE